MKVDCNRIVIYKQNHLGIVKDSCMGCNIIAKYCAINGLLEDAGLLGNWKKWDVPNFRDRGVGK